MKVLFIYPNTGSQLGFSYGLASISAVLKKAGHEAEIMHLCEKLEPLPTREEFLTRVENYAPDIIGFSVVSTQWNYTLQLAEWLRSRMPQTPLVCGGPHATMVPEQILETGLIDYVFTGESEKAFLEFIERKEQGRNLADVRNLGMMTDEGPVINPVRPLPDVKSLPAKDYELFDFQNVIDRKNGWVGLMSSRGCPFNCTYCFNHKMVKKYREDLNCSFKELNYIRYENISDMIDEIDYLLNNYTNIKMFIFDDDLFTYDKSFVREFCEAYKTRFDIPFVVNGHVAFFDDERAQALSEAGCRIVKFGVESGSSRIRDNVMQRHMSNEQIKEAIRSVHRYNMHSSTFIMIGLPYEDQTDVTATIDLLADAQPGRFRWSFFYPFPGTEAHRMSVEGGYIDESKMGSLMSFTEDSCLDFGEEQNLFLNKVGTIMPWFVNARADFSCSDLYSRKTEELLQLTAEEWEHRKSSIQQEDKEISESLQLTGESHYAIKYNPFMGVISDYFLNEQ